MDNRNGFFKITDGSNNVKMRYFPPIGKGEKLKIDEVIAFLDKAGIKNYDLMKINELISGDMESEAVISDEGCYRFDESVDIKVTADKMYAIAVFYPSSSNGSRMTKEEIVKTINAAKVVFGIDDRVIGEFLNNPRYCEKIIVAQGQKPVEGKSASIEYNFQTDRSAKPRLREDGTVDFHHLNNISNVKAGDVLAVLTKEVPGVPGTDVYGNIIRPKKIARVVLKHGNNVDLSDDGLKLISRVNGHATLEDGKVFVSDNYDVPADVDNSTGDISYNGSITIKGNVRTGFAIEAAGDVEVFGVVEGAKISAGGDIILHRGIQGMGKSNIVAKGNLISKFIESADVKVEGYVETDTILNSNISARGDVYVRGKSASLIGGNVRSSTLIEAAVIGSPMGTATCVEVGIDPEIRDKIKRLKDIVAEKTTENEKLQQVLTMLRKKKDMGVLEPEKEPMLAQLTKNIILNTSEIKTSAAEIEETEKLLEENENAKIRAIKSIHPGTKIIVAGDYIYVHSEVIHSEYKKVDGEIKAVPLF